MTSDRLLSRSVILWCFAVKYTSETHQLLENAQDYNT